MNTDAVQCNQCGAPLEIPVSARFVTCRHCSSSLAVNRTPSIVTTEVIERVTNAVDQMASDVADLKRRAELQEIDEAWEREQKRYLIQTEKGATEPSEATGIVMAVVAVVGGLAFASVAASFGFGFGVVGGLVVGAIGVFGGISNINNARRLKAARQRYLARRAAAFRTGDADE